MTLRGRREDLPGAVGTASSGGSPPRSGSGWTSIEGAGVVSAAPRVLKGPFARRRRGGAMGSICHPAERPRPQSDPRLGVVGEAGARASLVGSRGGFVVHRSRFSRHLGRPVRPCGATGDSRARRWLPDAGGDRKAWPVRCPCRSSSSPFTSTHDSTRRTVGMGGTARHVWLVGVAPKPGRDHAPRSRGGSFAATQAPAHFRTAIRETVVRRLGGSSR